MTEKDALFLKPTKCHNSNSSCDACVSKLPCIIRWRSGKHKQPIYIYVHVVPFKQIYAMIGCRILIHVFDNQNGLLQTSCLRNCVLLHVRNFKISVDFFLQAISVKNKKENLSCYLSGAEHIAKKTTRPDLRQKQAKITQVCLIAAHDKYFLVLVFPAYTQCTSIKFASYTPHKNLIGSISTFISQSQSILLYASLLTQTWQSLFQPSHQ